MKTSLSLRSLAKVAVLVAVGSSVANLLLAALGKAISSPPETFGPYMYSSIIELTFAGVASAAAVYALMRRFIPDTAKANRYFIWLSIAVLVVSFYPDVAMPWSTDSDQVGWTYGIMANLMLMHVIAGASVMYFFTRRTGSVQTIAPAVA